MNNVLIGVGAVVSAAIVGLMLFSHQQAVQLISNPIEDRRDFWLLPEDFGLPYEDVTVTTEDGLELQGWFIAPQNGAVVMLQHGYKANRSEMLEEADMLYRHGYGSLITSIRSHDVNPGKRIYFGQRELQDIRAWYNFLISRKDISHDKIGAYGNSLGAAILIKFASQGDQLQAVMTHSAFSSLHETVNQSVQAFAKLPPFPFATLIMFWAEVELGFPLSEVNAKLWIAEISPRAVLILQGGSDDAISTKSGELLFEAAMEPKLFWFEPQAQHANFDLLFPEHFEKRMIDFFNQYLFEEGN